MRRLISPVLASIILAGCCTKEPTVSSGEPQEFHEGTYILYRMNGDRYPGEPVPEGSELLHGWEILESCQIESSRDRALMFKAFRSGQEEMLDSGSMRSPDCFQPRHAIRTIVDGGTTDYLICFQCWNFMVWTDGKPSGGGLTSDSPQETLDSLLEDCHSDR